MLTYNDGLYFQTVRAHVMDAAVAKIRDAFICQLSPNVTPNDRAAAFQIIQQFKSERSQDQIRIIFQLIEDDNRTLIC